MSDSVQYETAGNQLADRTLIHLPTPGDHYSAKTGSAVSTLIYEYNRWHAAAGHQSEIIVGRNTMHDYTVGVCRLVDLVPQPTKAQRALDVALGRAGLRRRWTRAVSMPLVNAIPTDTTAAIVVHNQPVILEDIRKRAPGSRIVLYCLNELFAHYSDAEVRRVVQHADRIICVSQFTADCLNKRLAPNRRIAVGIVNGVDTVRFCPVATKGEPTEPTILFVARIVPEKGADLLLRAAQELVNRGRKFHIRIVGSSNFNAADPLTQYEEELRGLAAPIQQMVTFVPFRDRESILQEYRAAHIFCAPSNWDEPCSLTVPEAIACGLPTVASRRGGIPEVGLDSVLYFDPPDVIGLADQLDHLLVDINHRRYLSSKARARAEEIRWENQYAKLYAEVFS